MCGRSSLTKNEKELESRFNATFYSDELERYNPIPNYNVAPTHMMPVIINEDSNHFRIFRWGLIPFWAKNVSIGYKMINARVETLLEKNAFKKAVHKRRCLVPMDGFYEWKKEGSKKQPYRIIRRDRDIFAVAGLWEKWTDPSNGQLLHTFTVITQAPNDLMSTIHDRMPAILSPEEEKLWIDNNLTAEEALECIHPIASEELLAYKVSNRVGRVQENDAGLIEPIDQTGKQGSLFVDS